MIYICKILKTCNSPSVSQDEVPSKDVFEERKNIKILYKETLLFHAVSQ